MLIFNCTKAAAEQLTRTHRGKKINILTPAPYKTIAESVQSPVFPETIKTPEKSALQWHWVVHCVSVLRKKYWVVMDYHSRYCVVFPAGKKGDELTFIEDFEAHLTANFHYQAEKVGIEEVVIFYCIEQYSHQINRCEFHQRGDGSVSTHIKQVVWQLESCCYDEGVIDSKAECLYFASFCNFTPRSTKDSKDYFFPPEEFLKYWLDTFNTPPKSNHLRVVH